MTIQLYEFRALKIRMVDGYPKFQWVSDDFRRFKMRGTSLKDAYRRAEKASPKDAILVLLGGPKKSTDTPIQKYVIYPYGVERWGGLKHFPPITVLAETITDAYREAEILTNHLRDNLSDLALSVLTIRNARQGEKII